LAQAAPIRGQLSHILKTQLNLIIHHSGMSQPHILLIGKNGQVGWELRRALAPLGAVVAVDFPEIDLTDPASIRRWVDDAAPQIIVNAAAYTAVDKAEVETDLAMHVNAGAPGILAEEARKRGALLIHYSTDYVYDGAKQTPYLEDDAANPLSAYGRSKLAGDRAVQESGCAHLIFRLCWVYGARGQNFLLTMMRLARERDQLHVVADQLGAPTWARMIAEATAQAVCQVWRSSDLSWHNGIYHLSSAGYTSWHGFAEAIVSRMPAESRKAKGVEPITTAHYPTPARRPAYSVLSGDKLERTFGLRLPPWEESLGLVMES
jgi:dTDP-4-dehydrorhamnose reductase